MHNSSLAAAAAAAAASSPQVTAMQDAMKAYSTGMDDKYRYHAALGSMYSSPETIAAAAAAAKYMQEAAGKSYLDSNSSRYFETSSPTKNFSSGKCSESMSVRQVEAARVCLWL